MTTYRPNPPPLDAQATKHAVEGRPTRPITTREEDRMPVAPSSLSLVDLVTELATRGDCRHDPDLHMGPDAFESEPIAERLARQDVAREVCEDCPVWDMCFDYALRIRPTFGVWAGHLPRELAALRREVRTLPAPDLGEVA
ncbi:WhiB family transcriptional regulator [Actinomadura madurae]|uniref:WhiB family transcriptional regulator n=1 Tax=Actinomadura madurae TaxID=1993 RepID=UPI00399A04CD